MTVTINLTDPPLGLAAAGYTTHGLAVLPCEPGGKAPLWGMSWEDASGDPEKIMEWWSMVPRANIGVACIGDLVVLDVDGEKGEATLASLEAHHGALPYTHQVTTGNGRHLYFIRPEGLTEGWRWLGGGLELKANGYVLAPPSVHPSGRWYWTDSDPERAPLVEWLKASPKPRPEPRPAAGPGRDPERQRAYSLAALEGEGAELAAHSSEPQTQRDTALFAAACALGRHVAAGGLAPAEVWGALAPVAQQLGLPEDSIRRQIQRGLEEGAADPAWVPEEEPRRGGYVLDGTAQMTPGKQAAPPPVRAAPFPDPLGEHAYVGVLGRIVRTIEPHTEADPAAILAQLVAAVGCILGRGAGWTVEGDFHACMVWPLVVGASSTARKGTSGGRVRQVVRLVEPTFLAEHEVAGLSSGEGLIARLTPPAPDEDADPDAPPPTWDPRLLVASAEFAQVLRMIRREGNVLSPVLRELWDHGRAETLTRHAPLSCRDAHVAVLAHITDAELRRELTETDRANGLANRFLFVAAKRGKLLPFGGDLREEALEAAVGDLGETLAQVRRQDRLVGFTPLARRLWSEAYEHLTADRDGLAGAACTRAEAQVRRIAVIHALANGAATVDLPHLLAALALWHYAEQSACWALGDALGDPDADRLAGVLRTNGEPMDREQLRAAEGRHMGAARTTAALGLLSRRKLIRCWSEPTGGRPRELSQWCAESAESAVSTWPAHLSALTALTAQAETWKAATSDHTVELRPGTTEEAQ